MEKLNLSGIGQMSRPGKYTIEEREKVIAEVMLTGDINGTSKRTGIPTVTIRDWLKKRSDDAALEEVRRQQGKQFIREAWSVINEGLKVIRDKLDEATAKEAATIIGILVDKVERLAPTVIGEGRNSEHDIIEKISDEVLDSLISRNVSLQ